MGVGDVMGKGGVQGCMWTEQELGVKCCTGQASRGRGKRNKAEDMNLEGW
jgi:hypothetical protein